MSNLPTLKHQMVGINGEVLSGAKLYFYEAGTTTPYNTYSDEALTTPNANPAIADFRGTWGEIYLDPAQEYKVKLDDADDNNIWTVDNIKASELSGTSITTRVAQIASSPLDFGAVGDGVADESTEVQAAIDAATHTVDLLGKTFRCDSAITLASNITLKNGTLDFRNSADQVSIVIAGTKGASIALTSDATKGDDDVDLASVSGLADNDLLRLSSAVTWDGTSAAGQLVRIRDISSLNVRLYGFVDVNYQTADTAIVERITAVQNVTIQDVTILGDNSGTDMAVIGAKYCDGLTLDRVRIEGIEDYGITLRDCARTTIRDCFIIQDDFAVPTRYGIAVYASTCDTLIENTTIHGLGDAIRLGIRDATHGDGQTRRATIRGCRTTHAKRSIYAETSTADITVDGCTIDSTAGFADIGVTILGASGKVVGNRIMSASAVDISPGGSLNATSKPWHYDVTDNNMVPATATSGTAITIGSGAANELVVVRGNQIVFASTGISVAAAGAVIEGNKIENPNTGISNTASKVRMLGNILDSCATVGITANAALQEIVIRGNTITTDSASNGITLGAVYDSIIDNNRIEGGSGAGGVGISYDFSTATAGRDRMTIANNQILDYSKPIVCTLDATYVLDKLLINGNTIEGSYASSGYHGIEVSGAAYSLLVNGNIVRCGGTAAGQNAIDIAGDATLKVVITIVSGNIILKGAYCLAATNCTNILHDGNFMGDFATAQTSGAMTAGDII